MPLGTEAGLGPGDIVLDGKPGFPPGKWHSIPSLFGSILMVAGPFQLPALQSGTLSRILSGTRPSVQTVSDVCLRCICLLDTSALSALEVL